jgi:hypothetical protein
MPLRKIHHPVGAYTAEERKEFAEAITRVYQAVPIPRFYAVIIRPAGGPRRWNRYRQDHALTHQAQRTGSHDSTTRQRR